MKKLYFFIFILFALSVSAQNKEKVPAAKGVVYGEVSQEKAPLPVDDLQSKITDNSFSGQIKGKVVEVCKAEGCWLRLQKADGGTVMVRADKHAFFMPENIVGKTVLVEGTASVKETSEEMRKHYAEDAGKSKEEIAKIKGSEKNVEFAAKGVKVLD
jgi:hypothetical protein